MVHTLTEAMHWFISHSSGSVICNKGDEQKECFSYLEAEDFYTLIKK
ncbi:MAG: hypothetical protein V4608_10880 [Bacteroidota bacterium]